MGKRRMRPYPLHRPKKPPPRVLPQPRNALHRFFPTDYGCSISEGYKLTARAVAAVLLENADLASLLDEQLEKRLFKLASIAITQSQAVDYLLKKFEILEKNPFLDKWMAKVLVTELLWGKQWTKAGSPPVEAIKYYEEVLRESFIEVTSLFPHPENIDVAPILPTYIRVNTLLVSIEELIQAFINEGGTLLPRCYNYSDHLNAVANLKGNCFMRDYHLSELLIFPPGSLFYEHPNYLKKLFLIQDKGSCLSSLLLKPEPGSTVLDVGAAPGLKTIHMANIIEDTGLIYAVDIHPDRSAALRNMIYSTRVQCVKDLQIDYLEFEDNKKEDIKYILIDLTSTQSGIFSNKPRVNIRKRIVKMRFYLRTALRYCLQCFPKVRRLAYTVCSLYQQECEDVVADALGEVGDSFTLVDLKHKLGSGWKSFGVEEYNFSDKCIRTVPEVDLCQGHFIAVFERNPFFPVPPYKNGYNTGTNNKKSKKRNFLKNPMENQFVKKLLHSYEAGSSALNRAESAAELRSRSQDEAGPSDDVDADCYVDDDDDDDDDNT